MIPNVTKGKGMRGLLSYLVGPGKRNEHTDPHLVAGDPAVLAWHDDHELGGVDAASIARHLDRPRHAFAVDVPGGHVWHCSLSLRADEGELSDEAWGRIATSFLAKMGLDDQQGSKAPVRWVAVRHGVSSAGNDHVHLVVNRVREDGTKASVHDDYKRAQSACRELEAEHGLARLGAPELAGRGYQPAEVEAAARRAAQAAYEATQGADSGAGWKALDAAERDRLVRAQSGVEAARVRLARTVRGCSTAAGDEAEFVRRLRRAGVLVRPRLASGREDVVTGYSVGLRPTDGEKPVWYGGGRLDRDLTLPRLREEWPDTPQAAGEAAAEWSAARRGQRPVAPGRETHQADPQLWQQAARELAALREQLRAVPPGDVDTWARVARQTSGAYAAWSMRVEPTPGPLAAGAAALARCAQTRTAPAQRPTVAGPSAVGTAMLLAAAAAADDRMAQALVLRQLLNLSKAVYDAAKASGDARRAQAIETAVRQELAEVVASLPEPGRPPDTSAAVAAAGTTARQAQQGPVLGSPVPNRLEPDQRRRVQSPAPGRGTDQGMDGR